MEEKKGSLIPLRDIISDLVKGKTASFNPDDAEIWNVWEEAVGTGIARHARPSWIKGGSLRILVSDPIWLQELRFMEKEIRDKLNHALGRIAVKKIEFRSGS